MKQFNGALVTKEELPQWLSEHAVEPHPLHGLIKSATFVSMGESCSTICELAIECDHTVIGYSRPVNTNNFNAGLGMKMAFIKARDELWREVALISRLSNNPDFPKQLKSDY